MQSRSGAPKRREKAWFWLLFSVVIAGIVLGVYGTFFSPDMLRVVDSQLATLRENRVTQAYYDYTSKAFQENTSLDAFRNFLTLYNVLSNNKSFRFDNQTRDTDIGKINGVLISNDLAEMKAEYLLVKEDNEWKIQSILLKELPKRDSDSGTQLVVNLVHEQLQALQKDDAMDAYYSFFSKEFQNETSFKAFQDYVRSYPILTSYKNMVFKTRKIEDSVGYVDVELGSDSGQYLLEYMLKFRNGEWKIWNLRLVLPPEEASELVSTDPNSLSYPVREWLDALLVNKVKKAYANTSKDFQDTTSFSDFEKFVSSNPIFAKRDLTDIRSGTIDNGVGKLEVNLHDDEGLTVIEFKLGFDEGVWKIWGMRVVESPELEETETITQEPESENLQELEKQLIDVVTGQLKALKYQDFKQAYEQYASNEYRRQHTFADFERFIESTSPFTERVKSSFESMGQRGGTMILRGELTGLDNKKYLVEYELVREGKEWKINRFEKVSNFAPIAEAEIPLKNPELAESVDRIVSTTDVKKIKIGDEVDQNGMIKTPRIVLDSDINLLFFNVDVEKGEQGALVMLFLTHVDSGTAAPPLSTKLKKSGLTTISFSYAAPADGWPEGNYVVKVTTSSGDEHFQRFQVRKGEKQFY